MELLNVDITGIIQPLLELFVSFFNWGFTLWGVSISIGSWFAICIILGLIIGLFTSITGFGVKGIFLKGTRK